MPKKSISEVQLWKIVGEKKELIDLSKIQSKYADSLIRVLSGNVLDSEAIENAIYTVRNLPPGTILEFQSGESLHLTLTVEGLRALDQYAKGLDLKQRRGRGRLATKKKEQLSDSI